jgi:hypothetical protein
MGGSMFGDLWKPEITFAHDPSRTPTEDWSSRVAGDFGVTSPSVFLFAVQARESGAIAPGGLAVPKGTIVVIDELHTATDDDLNEGIPTAPQTLGEMVLERCRALRVRACGVCDDAVGFDPVNSTVLALFRQVGLYLSKPNKTNRPGGWSKIRQMLFNAIERNPDRPWLLICDRARYLHQTAPVIARSRLRADDIETKGPDHALDALRYLVTTPAPASGVTPHAIY